MIEVNETNGNIYYFSHETLSYIIFLKNGINFVLRNSDVVRLLVSEEEKEKVKRELIGIRLPC